MVLGIFVKKTPKKSQPLMSWQLRDAARLKSIYEEKVQINQREFGRQSKIGSQSMVWQYLNGRSALNLDAAVKFARALGVPVSAFSETLSSSLGAMDIGGDVSSPGRVPLLTWEQVADFVSDNLLVDEVVEWVDTTLPVSENTFALRVKLDAMSPEFPPGAVLVAEHGLTPENGDYLIVLNEGGASFRQLVVDGVSYLKPLNDRYPIREMGNDQVVGVVRLMERRFR